MTSKDFQSAPGGQDKFLGALILGVAGSVLPSVIQALTKQGFAPAKDFGGNQDKFWGALTRVVASTLPTLIREITKSGIEPQKDFGGEEKFWGAIASVVSAALPAVVQALSKQGVAPQGVRWCARDAGEILGCHRQRRRNGSAGGHSGPAQRWL